MVISHLGWGLWWVSWSKGRSGSTVGTINSIARISLLLLLLLSSFSMHLHIEKWGVGEAEHCHELLLYCDIDHFGPRRNALIDIFPFITILLWKQGMVSDLGFLHKFLSCYGIALQLQYDRYIT